MSKIEESITDIYKEMVKYKDGFLYFANKDNSLAINFLSQSIVDRFDSEPIINSVETKIMYNLFVDFHKKYLNKLTMSILKQTNKLNLKED